jgi:hypothetical protein
MMAPLMAPRTGLRPAMRALRLSRTAVQSRFSFSTVAVYVNNEKVVSTNATPAALCPRPLFVPPPARLAFGRGGGGIRLPRSVQECSRH